MLICLCAAAQHNHRTGYFLDGYTYKYKLNPAFGADRGYFAIPVLGYTTVGAETNLKLSNFLYPTADGTLTTFLSPSVSAEQAMKGIHDMNPLNVNADLAILSFGFNAGKSFNTVDLSLKADARVNVPGGLFSWAKEYADVLDLSRLGVNVDSRLELAYGYSRTIGQNIRVGARIKLLAGLAKARYSMDKLTLRMNEQAWTVESAGEGFMSSPLGILTEGDDARITGFEIPEVQQLADKMLSGLNLGMAVDLGFSMDIIKYLTVSASITDLGFISWNNVYRLGAPDKPWEYKGFEGIGNEDMNIEEQFGVLGEELLSLVYPCVSSSGGKLADMLSMTAHVGVEFRMPFWQRLSVGALGTARIDGPYSWYEGRASVNLALFRWLSFTGNYAYSTFGESYGAALNLHPAGFNLFIGLDSFKPLMNVTPQYVPIDSFNTNLAIGLNIAFGKYKGRYQKKAKK